MAIRTVLNRRRIELKHENWLITGGARYIGLHIAAEFLRLNFPFSIIDYDVNKLEVRLPNFAQKFFGDIRNMRDLDLIFSGNTFPGVIHLAALKSVEENDLVREYKCTRDPKHH